MRCGVIGGSHLVDAAGADLPVFDNHGSEGPAFPPRDILYRELAEFYDSHRTGRRPELLELPIQYADYAAWQRGVMEGYAQKQLGYWKEKLAGAPARLELPTDYPRPATQTSAGGHASRLLLNPEDCAALKAFGLRENATLFMTTLACAKLFLYRHTRQTDIVVGTPIGRFFDGSLPFGM